TGTLARPPDFAIDSRWRKCLGVLRGERPRISAPVLRADCARWGDSRLDRERSLAASERNPHGPGNRAGFVDQREFRRMDRRQRRHRRLGIIGAGARILWPATCAARAWRSWRPEGRATRRRVRGAAHGRRQRLVLVVWARTQLRERCGIRCVFPATAE